MTALANPLWVALFVGVFFPGCLRLPPPGDALDEGGNVPRGTHVAIPDVRFDPPVLRAAARVPISWTNHDAVGHTVTPSDAQRWGTNGSNLLATGASWSHTFAAAGAYDYYCVPHSVRDADGAWRGMTGRILVEDSP